MSFSTGLTGLNTAVARLDTAAANIARASTTTPPMPLSTQNEAAPAGADLAAPTVAPSVDIVSSVIEQISASAAFLANVKTIEATDQNLESLMKLR